MVRKHPCWKRVDQHYSTNNPGLKFLQHVESALKKLLHYEKTLAKWGIYNLRLHKDWCETVEKFKHNTIHRIFWGSFKVYLQAPFGTWSKDSQGQTNPIARIVVWCLRLQMWNHAVLIVFLLPVWGSMILSHNWRIHLSISVPIYRWRSKVAYRASLRSLLRGSLFRSGHFETSRCGIQHWRPNKNQQRL